MKDYADRANQAEGLKFTEYRNPFLVLFVCFALVGIAAMAVIHTVQHRSVLEHVSTDARAIVKTQRIMVSEMLGFIASDLMVVAHGTPLHHYFETSDPDILLRYAEQLRAISQSKMIYDQLRFLDRDGMEKVRVDLKDGHAVVIPTTGLQDKSGRYYFQETAALPAGRIYVSPLDLNIEHGTVEVPLKPMIRFATPVFDRHARFQGIVILNVLARNLIERIELTAQLPEHVPHFLDSRGYWFLSDIPADEWGFMFPGREDRTFERRFPRAWVSVRSEEKGQFRTAEGFFTFTSVYPLRACKEMADHVGYGVDWDEKSLDDYVWKIISLTPESVIDAKMRPLLFLHGFELLVILCVSCVLALVLSRQLAIRRRNLALQKDLLRLKDVMLTTTRMLTEVGRFQEVLTSMQDSFRKMLGADYGLITVRDNETCRDLMATGLDEECRSRITAHLQKQGVCDAVAHSSGLMFNNNFQTILTLTLPMEITSRCRVTSLLGAPIVYKEHIFGTVILANTTSKKNFTPQDRELLENFVAHLASQFNTSRLYQEIRTANTELEERVQSRTAQLSETNTMLRDAIAKRDRITTMLTYSEARFRSTFEQAAVGICHVSPGGKFIRINDKLCEILGYDRQELLGLTFQEITVPEDLQKGLKGMGRIMTGEAPSFSIEKRYIRKDKRHIWCRLTAALVFRDDGRPKYLISVIADITEEKKNQEALVVAMNRAEAANVAKANFISSMSHELRTPLHSVVGFSEVLLDEHFGPLNERQKGYMEDVLLAGRKLNAVIDDVLDLGRMEGLDTSGKGQEKGLDPAEAVRQSLASMEGGFKEKGVSFTADIAQELPRVFVDPTMFAKVIAALVDNALKFTPEQGQVRVWVVSVDDCTRLAEEPQVEDEGEKRGHRNGPATSGIRVCVEDSGLGIDPDLLERVFEPFFQIQGGITGKTPGTGLGLSLVKRFVEINGGRVRAYSHGAGKGCCFCFTLPGGKSDRS